MEKIAIIGMSCLFPDAQTPEEFWENLMAGKDSISLATEAQMGVDPDIFYDPDKEKAGESRKYYCKRGGYIKNFQFEPSGYRFPPRILEQLDDIYKWSLYVSKQALLDSGYLGDLSVLANCGVILGNLSLPTKLSHHLVAPIYYKAIDAAVQELLQQPHFKLKNLSACEEVSRLNLLTASYPSTVIAQALSLSGITFSLDAACASSLYAVKLACHYLLSGKADLMLAGAVNCTDPLLTHTTFSLFQAYPDDGTSCPLDRSSKGMMTGQGAGMLVLKRYSDALRDGDRIYATVLGVGLSNDGRGKHFLSPNPKGQMLAFERAYAEAKIDPQSIYYVECHATGTPLGDPTELNSMETFFGQYGNAPLVGSVKSNLGHLITAAGMPSMLKVILSMSKGLIPPTINVSEPISSSKGAIASDKVVKSATPWFEQASLQRGAVSAFGFGGTNSHLILERESQDNSRASGNTKGTRDLAREKMAIVGMDSFFGSCNSLTAFERCIYEGHQSFIPVSGDRWQGIEAQGQILKDYGFTNAQAPLGGYIKDFAMDYLHCKIPPNPDDQPIPQQLLILKVADQAIRDAGLEQGANVAAIVAMETELTCHKVRTAYDLEWQVEASLAQSNIALPPEKICELKNIVSDSIIKPMQVNQCLSFIGNIMASRISALWNLSGPSFTLSAQENSTFKALEVAQMLLAENQVDAVVVGAVDLTGGVENVLLRQQMASINTGKSTLSYDRHVNGWTVGEGAGAVVLKRLDRAKQNQDRIYAAIDAISLVQENSTSEPAESLPQPPQAQAVTQACQQAFQAAGIKPEDIGYLEVFGSGVSQEDEAEVEGLLQAYQTNQPELSCAIGSVKANIGHTYAASGMASLIKTALCLYHEYLPATPQWSGAKQPEAWQGSPFYVAPESRNWFLPAAVTKRVAAINGLGLDRAYAHLILSEEPSQKIRSSQYLAETPFYLFPLAADDRSALLEQLGNLQQTLEDSTSLVTIANQIFADFQKHSQAKYALAIVGHNREELNREIQRALKGVAQTFDRGEDWKTPLGSYFTARPLSKQGGVAFVYPGSFTSYIGIGQDIYHLFPKTLDSLASFTSSQSVKQLMYSACQLVYPRSLERLSKRQLEALEVKLLDDPIAMLMSGIVTAQGLTTILQDYFQVKPKAAFGYSLGEVSMMFAHNVWTNIDEVASKVNSSSLFRNRISGSKNAVRDYWGLDTIQKPTSEDFWSTYVLINPAAVVKECLKNEDRVYLTQINTPDEVVIAGDTQSCLKVIKQLGCNYFPAPSSNVIHCEAIQSEFDEFVKWFTLPCQSVPEIDFYSAADYTRTTLSSQTIAHSIAKALCNPLDFPRLINQIYEDGARIFIEVGPGNTCCRWIRETLKHKDQIAIPLNSRGLDDHKSIVRALAQLLSNRVSVDLSCLYGQSEVTMPQKKSLVKTVTVGGCQLKSTILSAENQKKFVPQSIPVPAHNASIEQSALPKVEKSKLTVATSSVLPNKKKAIADNHHQRISTKKLSREINVPQASHSETPLKVKQNNYQSLTSAKNQVSTSSYPKISTNGHNLHYQKLSENKSQTIQIHTAFLRSRQEVLQQMGEMIQLQIAVWQNLIDSKLVQESPEKLIVTERISKLEKNVNQKVTESNPQPQSLSAPNRSISLKISAQKPKNVIFDEADLLELAEGKIAKVFGEEYKIIDSYPRRIQPPMPPFLFISRVTRLEAKRGCFKPCLIETEYDIPHDAWYASKGQVPCVIPMEASHGNILLSSYLGIDFEIKGQRLYRALDGEVTFLSELPQTGDTIRTLLRINTFARSSGTLIYFFTCDYFVEERKFLKLKAGAGFFTPEELNKGMGVPQKLLEKRKTEKSKIQKQHFQPLLCCSKAVFDEQDLLHLSNGNIAACFGQDYHQQSKNPRLCMAPASVRMFDRVLSVEPHGGAWGLGLLVAEKTLDPKAWYFNCHFKDDFCLPGTLVSEGVIQLLSFYLLYLGLQTLTTNATLQPLTNLNQSALNRGQILPVASKLTYRLEICEIGLKPTPYAKGEAEVIFEGKTIRIFQNLGTQLLEKHL